MNIPGVGVPIRDCIGARHREVRTFAQLGPPHIFLFFAPGQHHILQFLHDATFSEVAVSIRRQVYTKLGTVSHCWEKVTQSSHFCLRDKIVHWRENVHQCQGDKYEL